MTRFASGVLTALLLSTPLAADSGGFVRLTPAEVAWQDLPGSPGVRVARIHGDSRRTGFYIERLKFPPGVVSAPHSHLHDRHITVLEGTWWTGVGSSVDLRGAVPLPAGSYMFHPAGAAHWDGSASAQPVTIQVMGEAPATATPANPGGMWVQVSDAERDR